ncbi:hypothetical protein [Streptomyces sp. NPDC054838]
MASMPIFAESGSLWKSRAAWRFSFADASTPGVFWASYMCWAARVIHFDAPALYSASRSVALPAEFTHTWKAWAVSPSQPVTLWFLRFSPISLIALAASSSSVARVRTSSGLIEAIIAISCSWL